MIVVPFSCHLNSMGGLGVIKFCSLPLHVLGISCSIEIQAISSFSSTSSPFVILDQHHKYQTMVGDLR